MMPKAKAARERNREPDDPAVAFVVRQIPVTSPIVNHRAKLPRNGPCPCGSGRKWKLCHLPTARAGATGPIKATS